MRAKTILPIPSGVSTTDRLDKMVRAVLSVLPTPIVMEVPQPASQKRSRRFKTTEMVREVEVSRTETLTPTPKVIF